MASDEVRPAHALGAAHAGGGRSGQVRCQVLAGLLPADPCRRGLPERGRLRGLLSDQGPVPPPQRLAGQTRIPSASCSKAAASWAWWCWRAPIRTPPTRTSTRRTPTGSRWTPRASKRRHWASPEMWVTCALGPYNFEFMTEVTREIVSMYKVDGIFSNRWAGSGMCYCEHCRKNFRAYCGMDLPVTNDRAGPGAQEVPGLAAGAAVRAVAACGTRRSARSIPARASSPTRAVARRAIWT